MCQVDLTDGLNCHFKPSGEHMLGTAKCALHLSEYKCYRNAPLSRLLCCSCYTGADRSSWLRPVMRKLDYYTICYTSTVLRRAAHIPLPSAVTMASMLIAPVKPSMVTGLNLLLVEVRAESCKGMLCRLCVGWVSQSPLLPGPEGCVAFMLSAFVLRSSHGRTFRQCPPQPHC